MGLCRSVVVIVYSVYCFGGGCFVGDGGRGERDEKLILYWGDDLVGYKFMGILRVRVLGVFVMLEG